MRAAWRQYLHDLPISHNLLAIHDPNPDYVQHKRDLQVALDACAAATQPVFLTVAHAEAFVTAAGNLSQHLQVSLSDDAVMSRRATSTRTGQLTTDSLSTFPWRQGAEPVPLLMFFEYGSNSSDADDDEGEWGPRIRSETPGPGELRFDSREPSVGASLGKGEARMARRQRARYETRTG